MTYWKAWSDTRYRFLLCAALLAITMVPGIVMAAGEAEGFRRFVDGWAHGMEQLPFAILAIVLAVGGTMTESNARSNLMTLSLPVPRARWLISQWIVVTLMVFCLAFSLSLIMAVAGAAAGRSVPVAVLFGAFVLNGLAAALWVWPAMLATSLSKEAVRAALIVVGLMMILDLGGAESSLSDWRLSTVADLTVWQRSVPWRALLAGAVLMGGAAWLTLRRFQQTDY
jgi:ABC-type transport system involved in multi-copper enzyme maturation permease subunit